MTPPITATPAQPAAMTSPTRAALMPPMASTGTRDGARDFGKALAADLRSVARLARRFESRTGERIIGRSRIDRFGLGDRMDRNADKFFRAQQRPRGGGIAAGGQMHAVGAGELCQRGFAMQHEPRAMTVRDRQEPAQQRHLLVLGQILLAHTHPAAAADERRGDDFSERSPRLRAVGHQQQWRIGKPHRARSGCRLSPIMGNLPDRMNRGRLMRHKSMVTIMLAGALAVASLVSGAGGEAG